MISSDQAYDLFAKITGMSGNSKMSVLRGQDVKEYLLAAYDPFTKYYLTRVSPGCGQNEFDDITWLVLEDLSSRRLSGYNAQHTVDLVT